MFHPVKSPQEKFYPEPTVPTGKNKIQANMMILVPTKKIRKSPNGSIDAIGEFQISPEGTPKKST
jgi:hypothetical protein